MPLVNLDKLRNEEVMKKFFDRHSAEIKDWIRDNINHVTDSG
jgi:hypothetical protein